MRRLGWIIGGYLLAVIMVAVMLLVVVATLGPGITGSVGKSAFLGKLVGAGVVAFAPIYLGARGGLLLFSSKNITPFVLAFIVPCLLVFAGMAQVPDLWLIDWISDPSDMAQVVREEQLGAQLWGGFGFGPLFFTGVGLTFWGIAGACFGLVVWWSEQDAASSPGVGGVA